MISCTVKSTSMIIPAPDRHRPSPRLVRRERAEEGLDDPHPSRLFEPWTAGQKNG